MANPSILAAFERMWQHTIAELGNKADLDHTHDEFTNEELIELLVDLEVIEPVLVDSNGLTYIDKDGSFYTL